MYRHFLDTWRKSKDKFIKPKLHWYFGSWRHEHNLPVWRRGPMIYLGKSKDYETKWSYAKLLSSEWTDEGRKSHPILSKIFKPVYQLPIWLSFYCFNHDVEYKVGFEDDDFCFEHPPHFTLVFFGLCISVTAYIPQENEDDWLCNDAYWESMLTYQYYNGDIKKTNASCGCYTKANGDKNKIIFQFNPRFLKNKNDREYLRSLQENIKGNA